MDADNVSCAGQGQAGELILHRPKTMTAGAARRIHVYRDDVRIANLGLGATARVPTDQGPHLLRARCVPLISANFPIILAANETLRVLVFVDAMEQLEIQLDEEPNPRSHPDPASETG